MRHHLRSAFGLLMISTAAASCQKGPESSPALPPPAPSGLAPSAPLPTPDASASAASTPAAASRPTEYPMCGGQKLAAPAAATRAGAVNAQLAPAFLDEMSEC